jgi:nucleotide-binding universal stress UspA family protein
MSMLFRTILHPTDFSLLSTTAFAYAAQLAHDFGSRLLILHAVETLGPENVSYGEATSFLQPEAYRQRLWEDLIHLKPPYADVAVEPILSDKDPARAILDIARERSCDLIVLGSHGRRGWRRLMMGSVAEQVVRRASCPTLVVNAATAERLSLPELESHSALAP